MEIKDLKTGAARIAAAADVPLLPVLWGTQRLMTKDHHRTSPRHGHHVSVGAPVPLSGDAVADTRR